MTNEKKGTITNIPGKKKTVSGKYSDVELDMRLFLVDALFEQHIPNMLASGE